MILYEYKCFSCGARFQKFIPLKNRNKVSCPGCKSKNVKKIIATVSKFKKIDSSSCGCNCAKCKGC